jgi:DNA primase
MLGHVNGLVVRDIYQKEYRQYFLDEAKKLGTFFGLYEAFPEILRTKKVFIHEAALDSISFAKVFPNSVSVLTSFMNEVQYETLSMLADKIIMVFDEDSAGNIGRDQVYNLYGRKLLSDISIGYNDSNAILKRLGPESFKKYIWNRVPILLRE